MSIIDFRHTRKRAFVRGLVKGLAAPLMLYGRFRMPEMQHVDFPEISDRSVDAKNISSYFTGSLKKISLDDNR